MEIEFLYCPVENKVYGCINNERRYLCEYCKNTKECEENYAGQIRMEVCDECLETGRK